MLTQALAIKLDLLNDVVAVGLRLPRQCVCDWRCGRGRGTVVGAIGSNTKLKLSSRSAAVHDSIAPLTGASNIVFGSPNRMVFNDAGFEVAGLCAKCAR